MMRQAYEPKPITKEQEDMLARLACAPVLRRKHWKQLKRSGLTTEKKIYSLSPFAEFLVNMITTVHGPNMKYHQLRFWHIVLTHSKSSVILEKFWEMHPLSKHEKPGLVHG